jgi:hypothetical protein
MRVYIICVLTATILSGCDTKSPSETVITGRLKLVGADHSVVYLTAEDNGMTIRSENGQVLGALSDKRLALWGAKNNAAIEWRVDGAGAHIQCFPSGLPSIQLWTSDEGAGISILDGTGFQLANLNSYGAHTFPPPKRGK